MKSIVESAEQSDTRRDESSRPSSDTLDSLVLLPDCPKCAAFRAALEEAKMLLIDKYHFEGAAKLSRLLKQNDELSGG